jgi:hypothetical protein
VETTGHQFPLNPGFVLIGSGRDQWLAPHKTPEAPSWSRELNLPKCRAQPAIRLVRAGQALFGETSEEPPSTERENGSSVAGMPGGRPEPDWAARERGVDKADLRLSVMALLPLGSFGSPESLNSPLLFRRGGRRHAR